MIAIFSNNATGNLGGSITGNTLTLQTGQGALFPSPADDQYFPITVSKSNGDFEIMQCTQRSGDVLTVIRSVENTTAKTFQIGDRVSLRITAQSLSDFISKDNLDLRTYFSRACADLGMILSAGSFESGATLTASNQCLLSFNKKKIYSWTGGFNKVVTKNSTASTSGGVGSGAWVDRTQETLRDELSEEGGVNLVNGAMNEYDIGLKPIYKMSSYLQSDIYAAWLDSISLYGYVYLSGGNTTQYTLNGAHTDLQGSTVLSDPGVTLIVPQDNYPLLGSLKINGDLKIKTASINASIQSSKIDKVSPVARLKNNLLTPSIINFSDCYCSSVLGDVFTPVSRGSNSNSAILIPLTVGADTGLFCPITAGEAISAHLRVNSGAATSVGVMLRCTNGWIKIKGTVGASGFAVSYKATGASEVQGGSIMGPNASLLSYAAGNSVIGVSLLTPVGFNFIINGIGSTPNYSPVGDILDIGFIFGGASGTSEGRVTGLCCYKAEKSAYGYGPLNIDIYGDSTADKYAGSFDKYLPQLLDGENASRTRSIRNFAIAGQTFQQQLDLLKTNGPGEAYIICMVAGTNDIQCGMTADTFVTKINDFIDYCAAHGRVPMLVEPWMWYPSDMIGGAGQPSSNYQNGSELREAGKRVAIQRGAIYVSTTHELPAPLPAYFDTDIDPLLRDDIHQSQLGYRLYAELIASHIISFMGQISKKGIAIPTLWKTSVVSSITSSSVSETGFSGGFQVSGFSNASVILNLPRWCRPPRTINVPAVFTGVGGGQVYSAFATVYADGRVVVDGLTTSSGIIVINAKW